MRLGFRPRFKVRLRVKVGDRGWIEARPWAKV